jgi:hypothetical protein
LGFVVNEPSDQSAPQIDVVNYLLLVSFHYDGSQLEWPQDVLLSTVGIEDSTQKDSIRRGTLEEQTKDIKRLRKLLKIHAKIVTEANNRLREFIVANFSIADVL